MTREILGIAGDKIDTNRILLVTKINQQNSACDKIARPYFHFSLTSQVDVIIISVLISKFPAAGLQ
jgi:hypothetical protein